MRLDRLGDPKDSIPAFLPPAWLFSICRLLAGTVLWVAVAAVALTPYGRHLRTWLLG